MMGIIILIPFLFDVGFTAEDWHYSSGDEEIDLIRLELANKPTGPDNFPVRALLMKLWAVSLQQQGAILIDRYLHIDDAIRKIEAWNPVFSGGEPQVCWIYSGIS